MSKTPFVGALMKRDDYKAVKRMDRAQMTAYCKRVYMRGYNAGFQAAENEKAAPLPEVENTPSAPDTEAEQDS